MFIVGRITRDIRTGEISWVIKNIAESSIHTLIKTFEYLKEKLIAQPTLSSVNIPNPLRGAAA